MRRLLLTIAGLGLSGIAGATSTLFDALDAEMARSMQTLRFEDHGPPYYMAYRVSDVRFVEQGASQGALTLHEANHSRTAQVDLRLGSYELDSSRVIRAPMSRSQIYDDFSGQFTLPLGDDVDEIRRVLWLATDRAYKRAIEDFSVKKATLQAQGRLLQPRQDLVPGEARVALAGDESHDLAGEALGGLLLALSGGFVDQPELQGSYAWLQARHRTVYLLTSEGSRLRQETTQLTLGMVARTQAEDGAALWSYRLIHANGSDGLPALTDLRVLQDELIAELLAMRKAPRIESYLGPVLFTGQASAALFAGVVVPELTGVPEIYAADVALGSYAQGQADRVNRFARRIRSRVLPRGTTVTDNPLATTFGADQLLGHFRLDDEGTPARQKILVSDGRLRSILTTRTPVLNHIGSTGSARAGSALPGNLIVSSSTARDESSMNQYIARLIAESGSEYAIEVDRLLSREAASRLLGSQSYQLHSMDPRKPGILVAFRRYPDGRREYVRNIRLEQISVGDFRYLAALGKQPYVHHYHPPYTEAAAWLPGFRPTQVFVSLVMPSMLFEELSLSSAQEQNRRLPILPPPAQSAQ